MLPKVRNLYCMCCMAMLRHSFVNRRKKIRTLSAINKSIGIFSLFAGGPFGFEKNEAILFRKTRVKLQGSASMLESLKCNA